MSIITEQDQNNIYDLYEEGILNRARAGFGSLIGGSGIEGKLNNIIAQYKTKIGRELGDLEADFKTFGKSGEASMPGSQRDKLNNLLTNLSSVGIKSAQTMLDKFGHMIGRVAGAAAPAAAAGAATAALGGAPALVGAAAGLTRGLRNSPRTDIGIAGKLGRIGASTGIGALAGYGASKLNDYMSSAGGPVATPEGMPISTGGGGNALDTFRQLHGGAYDPKSSIDAAKMALQQMGQEQGLAGRALQDFVYNNGGTTTMNGNVARETLRKLGTSIGEVNSGLSSSVEGALPPIPSSAYPDSTYASRISAPTDRIAPPITNSRFSGPSYAERISAPSLPSRFNELGVNPDALGMRDVRDLAPRYNSGSRR